MVHGERSFGQKGFVCNAGTRDFKAAIAQLGERQTEDLEVSSSILGHGI